MGAYLEWSPKSAFGNDLEIDGPTSKSLFFDVVTEETTEFASTATEHPVEDGANISDHVHKELTRMTLECFVSNEPIYDLADRGGRVQTVTLHPAKYTPPLTPTPGAVFGAVGNAVRGALTSLFGGSENSAQVLQFPSDFDAISETRAILEKLRDDVQLVTVVTRAKNVENMLIEKVSVRRNAGTGTGATFTLELKEVRKVQVKIVNAPIPTEIRGALKKSKGSKPTTAAEAAAKKKSVFKGIVDRIL